MKKFEWKRPTHSGHGGKSRTPNPKVEVWKNRLLTQYHAIEEWSRVHVRRWLCTAHDIVSDRRTMSPVYFLTLSVVLGVTVTIGTLYSTSYAVTVDGEQVGRVADQSVVTEAISNVEQEGRALLGYDYQIRGDVDYRFSLSLKSDLAREEDIENFFYGQLSEVSDELRKYQVQVDGKPIGAVDDENALNRLLKKMKNEYVTENTIRSDFVEKVSVEYIYDANQVLTIDEMEAALKANTTGKTTYEVAKGDTFNGIAYANDMSVSDLKALNPGVDVNRLMIGDVLNVKEMVPALSVRTVDHEMYTESLPCPVEEREDPSMYKGSSKIVREGVEGVAEVEADVTYINGYEREREVTSRKTVQEPTVTIKAIGTKERPKSASSGSYSWPVSGKISSYFGGRTLFGKYNFHSGIDIAVRYGAPIKAADGGKVTFAGWKGSYGYLVIITHDNGTQTYYGHNSSLVVSAGQRVYKGQTVAKAGSTGLSTGNHCHFEIRINGRAVNPLNYLP